MASAQQVQRKGQAANQEEDNPIAVNGLDGAKARGRPPATLLSSRIEIAC